MTYTATIVKSYTIDIGYGMQRIKHQFIGCDYTEMKAYQNAKKHMINYEDSQYIVNAELIHIITKEV